MKAWQVTKKGEPRDVLVQVGDAPLPEPGPGMARVRVDACGVGLPDLLMCRDLYALTPDPPFTPGQELTGVVTAVGEGAPARVGDRIMSVSGFMLGQGGFAEEAIALPDMCFPVPDWMRDDEAAAFLIPYHTAWIGLVPRGQLQPGETVLVLGGAGGTGSAAIQLARALGAGKVIATASGAEKVAFCEQMGADAVVDRSEAPIAEMVRELTGGKGVDVVYDPVGGDAYHQASRCVAHGGRILLVGFASGSWGSPSAPHMANRNYAAVGVMPTGFDRAFKDDAQARMEALYRKGEIRVPVGRAFDFDELPLALETLAGGDVMGKLVVRGPRPPGEGR